MQRPTVLDGNRFDAFVVLVHVIENEDVAHTDENPRESHTHQGGEEWVRQRLTVVEYTHLCSLVITKPSPAEEIG